MPEFKINIIQIIETYLHKDKTNEEKILFIKGEKITTCSINYNNNNSILQNSQDFSFYHDSNIYIPHDNISLLNTQNEYSSYDSNENNSTLDMTKDLINMHNTIVINNAEKQFNPIRARFCLKNNLYDIPLCDLDDSIYSPVKYKISETLFAFLYPNEIVTYSFTISGFLKTDNINFLPNIQKIENSQFNPFLGLFFCGQKIEIETDKGIETKTCSPHEFLCKKCNEINKNLYNIKKNYLINISGRVAKINKGRYHCFGHFLCKNQIEDCITKFCCKSCEILNLFSSYYKDR